MADSKKIEQVGKAIEEATNTLERFSAAFPKVIANIEKLANSVSKNTNQLEKMGEAVVEMSDSFDSDEESLDKIAASAKSASEKVGGVGSNIDKLSQLIETKTKGSLFESVNNHAGDARESMNQLSESVSKSNEELEDSDKKYDGVGTNIENLASLVKKLNDNYKNTSDYSADAGDNIERLAASLGDKEKTTKLSSIAVDALSSSLKALVAQGRAAWGVVGALSRGIIGVGTSVLAFPFRAMNAILEASHELAQIAASIREEWEKVRETFGALNRQTGIDMRNAAANIRAEGSNIAGTGLNITRVFGWFEDGINAITQEIAKGFEDMGRYVTMFSGHLSENAAEIAMFRKGLAITGDAFAQLGVISVRTGQSMTEQLRDINNLAIQMGDQFGMNAKLISSDVGEMRKNFGAFGTLATRELTSMAVFTRRLGVEISDLLGLVKQFDDFEGAAQSAALLAQSFGMNVDAIDLMMAADPAERLEHMRNAFFETGRAVEDMTRQEIALLAQQMGMTEQAVQMALAQENAHMTYQDIVDATEDAEDAPLTQAEAMTRLAESIRRITDIGPSFNSMWEALRAGLERGGILGMFSTLALNLRQISHHFMFFGINLMSLISKMEPVRGFMASLESYFDPSRWRRLLFGTRDELDETIDYMGGLIGVIMNLFEDLFSGDPERQRQSLVNFFRNLNKIMQDFLLESESGSAIIDGVRSMMIGMGRAMLGAIEHLRPYIIDAVNSFVDLVVEWFQRDETQDRLAQVGQMVLVWLATKMFSTYALSLVWGIISTHALPFLMKAMWGLVKFIGTAITTILGAKGIIAAIVIGVGAIIQNFREKFSEAISEWAGNPGVNIAALIAGVFDIFGGDGEGIFNSIMKFFTEDMPSWLNPVIRAIDGLLYVFMALWDGVKAVVNGVRGLFHVLFGDAEKGGELLGDAFDNLMSMISNLFSGILNIILSLGESIVRIIIGSLNIIKNAFIGWVSWLFSIPGRILDGFRNFSRRIVEGGSDMISGFMQPIRELPDNILSVFSGILDSIRNLFGIRSPSTVFQGIGSNIVSGLLGGLGDLTSRVGEIFGGVAERARNLFGGIADRARNALGGVRDGASNILGGLTSTLSEGAGGVGDSLMTGILNPIINMLAPRLIEALRNVISTVSSVLSAGLTTELGRSIVSGVAASYQRVLGTTGGQIQQSIGAVMTTMRSQFMNLQRELASSSQVSFIQIADEVLTRNVRRIEQEYAQLDRLLENGIPNISLSGTLRRFNEAISIARETITLEHRPININIDVRVVLDVDELAYELTSETRAIRIQPMQSA